MEIFKDETRNGTPVKDIKMMYPGDRSYDADYPIKGLMYCSSTKIWEETLWSQYGDYFYHTNYTDGLDLMVLDSVSLKTYRMNT